MSSSNSLTVPSSFPTNASLQYCYFPTSSCANYVCGLQPQDAPVQYLSTYNEWYCAVLDDAQVAQDFRHKGASAENAAWNTSGCGNSMMGCSGNKTLAGSGSRAMGVLATPVGLLVLVMGLSAVVGHLA
ncbi:hypothetical protein IAT38_006030 [Cryptococcus sp. DSM 104549]